MSAKSTDSRLVLDLETKRAFSDGGARLALDELGISVVGVYNYATDEFKCYEESEFGALQNLLIDASLIIGFNHVQFDMPVLQPYLSIDVTKLPVFDIMLDLQNVLGFRVSLDSVAQATLGQGKTGHGLDAIRYYNEGRWEELKSYCLQDVKVTRDVLEFGIANKNISYKAKFGSAIHQVKVNWQSYSKGRVHKLAEEQPPEPAQYKLF